MGFLFAPATGGPDPLAEVSIPAQVDWTDQGVILAEGGGGAWDLRMHGMLSPSFGIRRGTDILLGYIGATGDRGDGGPANRTLGFATLADGANIASGWVKDGSSPRITHDIHDANDTDEAGVFSAGAWLNSDDTLDVLFGGMEEKDSPGNVDADVVHTQAPAGSLVFGSQTDAIESLNSAVSGYGDEIHSFGCLVHPDTGTRYVYYCNGGSIASDGSAEWAMHMASGTSFTNLTTFARVLNFECKGGGAVIRTGPTSVCVVISTGEDTTRGGAHAGEFRTTTLSALGTLSTIHSQQFGGTSMTQMTVMLDRTRELWLWFYVTTGNDGIHLRTAPMVVV